MITDDERTQLNILDETETDFYAGLMFLGLLRLAGYMRQNGAPSPEAVRVIVQETYKDLNAKMEEDPS